MDIARLTRQSHRQPRAGLRLLDRFDMAGARTHEFCGHARRRLALWLAQQTTGEVMWIRLSWHVDRLHMAGVVAEIDPARLLLVEVLRIEDLMWTMEEALRSGAVALVIADLIEPPALTPVRRLHLAAEAGAEKRGHPVGPMGVVLTPGDGGGAGVESRWHLVADHAAPQTDAPQWQLSRRRARDAPPGTWTIRRDARGRPALQPQTREPAPQPA